MRRDYRSVSPNRRYPPVTLVRAAPLAVVAVLLVAPSATAAEDGAQDAEVRALARRAKLRTYHRSMGITTWISLGGTITIGTLRYANVIGFGQPLCAPGGGDPIFGTSFGCGDGLKIWHAIGATWTLLSYATTRILAGLMPDPDDAASGPGPHATRLRIHRALSWVHLAGIAAMPILGLMTSAATDAESRDALGTAHLVVGYSTFAAVSAAGSLMVF